MLTFLNDFLEIPKRVSIGTTEGDAEDMDVGVMLVADVVVMMQPGNNAIVVKKWVT